MGKRNKEKSTLEAMVKLILEEDDKYCGDDIHALTIEAFKRVYNMDMDIEKIRFIGSVARAKRKVQSENKKLKQMSKRMSDLEVEDAKYYAQAKQANKKGRLL